MNALDDMSEAEVLTAVCDSLSRTPIADPPDVEAIMASGSARRRRRLVPAATATIAAVAGAAIAVAALAPGRPPTRQCGRTSSDHPAGRLDSEQACRWQHLRDDPRAERPSRAARHAARGRCSGQRHVRQTAQRRVPGLPRRNARSSHAPRHGPAEASLPKAVRATRLASAAPTRRRHHSHTASRARPLPPADTTAFPEPDGNSDRPIGPSQQRRRATRRQLWWQRRPYNRGGVRRRAVHR